MKYEKPSLQEIELLLEGSFLEFNSSDPNTEGVDKGKDPIGGGDDGPGIWD